MSEQKVFTEKPIAYALSTVGGIIGGPLGLIFSPLALYLINRTPIGARSGAGSRIGIWACVGIIGAPLSWAPIIALSVAYSENQIKLCNSGKLAACEEVSEADIARISNPASLRAVRQNIAKQELAQKRNEQAGLQAVRDAERQRERNKLTINEISDVFSGVPRCDPKVPSCKVDIDSHLDYAFKSANRLLAEKEVGTFVVRIDRINQASDGWDVHGTAVWDVADENASAATGVGLALGLATVIQGGTVGDGIRSTALATKGSFDGIGKCLMSTDHSHTPATTVKLSLKNLRIESLDGVNEGSFVLVDGASLRSFKLIEGILDDPASKFFLPSNNSFASIIIEGSGGSATLKESDFKTKEFCFQNQKHKEP